MANSKILSKMKSFIVLVVVCATIGLSQVKRRTNSNDFQISNFSICIFVSLIMRIQSMSLEERKGMEQALVADCKTKEGGSDADEASVLARDMPTTPKAKCMSACVLETTGMVQNGKLSVDGAVAVAKMAYEANEEAMGKAREIANECANVADADRCELVPKLLTCVRDAIVKRGYDLKQVLY